MSNGPVTRYVTRAVTLPRPDPTRPSISCASIGSYFPPLGPVAAAAVMDGATRRGGEQ